MNSPPVIKGAVKDIKGEPVYGASVTVDGTLIGTTTNIDGEFILSNVELPAVLTVSFIGYNDSKVNVATYSHAERHTA